MRLSNTQDDAMLERLQHNSFGYFVHEVNRTNGLVLDKTAEGWPASIAAVGMALSCYPVGVERGFMSRHAAIERTLTCLRFFAGSDQSGAPDASGYKGFYFHFLDMQSGRRAWQCELSSIDTALFIAGCLVAGAYFDRDDANEAEIRHLARLLYERVDWAWMLNGGPALSHGWTPESGFLPYRWQGYDESLILYAMALGSPTHAVDRQAYAAWTEHFDWQCIEGVQQLHAGPLFIHQMSQVWLDLRGIRDDFMRAHDCDYFENSRRATLAQQRYAMRNPLGWRHYGEMCWGITASDGPGEVRCEACGTERVFHDYLARGVPFGPDDGTLAPWAVVASLPFAPEIVLPSVRHFNHLKLHAPNPYGFKASFNASFPCDTQHPAGWVSPYHFGINEGPTVLMIENFSSGLIWRLMRGCKPLVAGLKAAGFEGGWLASSSA